MRQLLPLFLALGLAACQSAPHPKTTAAPPATNGAAIRGQAFYLEKIQLAPGATLEVQMIDDTGATLAQQSFGGLHGPPYEFALPYDAARIDAAHQYALRATLRNAAGRLEFATDTRVPVAPGKAQRVELRLVRAALPSVKR